MDDPEIEALRHDIERHIAIASSQADEIERLRAALMHVRAVCETHPGFATNAIDEVARVALRGLNQQKV